jgi:hypothetical protein
MSEVIPISAKPLPTAIPEAPTEENRRFARRPCKLAAKLTFSETLNPGFESTRSFKVIVRNISRNGLCFLFFAQLYPDDLVALDFGDLFRSYRVARCRKISDQCYEIGVAACATSSS